MKKSGNPTIYFLSALLVCSAGNAALSRVDLDGDLSNGHEGVYDDVLDVTWLADANVAESNDFGVGASSTGAMQWATAEAMVAAMNASNGGSGYLGINNWRQPSVLPLNGSSFDTANLTYDGSTDNGFQIGAPISPAYNPNGQSPGFMGSEPMYHFHSNFEALGACYGVGTTLTACLDGSLRGILNAPDPNNYNSFFANIKDGSYWTGTELSASSPNAFYFTTNNGSQQVGPKTTTFFAWPVADGMYGTVLTDCTYDLADNYNPTATVDDGSCVFSFSKSVPVPAFTAALLGLGIFGVTLLTRRTSKGN